MTKKTGTAGSSTVSWMRSIIPALGLPGVLVMSAMFTLRPNLISEYIPLLGFVLCSAAAALEIRRRRQTPRPSPHRYIAVVPVCLLLADIWLTIRDYVTDPASVIDVFKDVLVSVGTVACAVIICRNELRMVAIARAFVAITFIFALSYVATAVMWAGIGIGSGSYAAIPISQDGPAFVYPPFTVTASTQTVFGMTFPRFTGFGREPGWMAMYCVAAFFMCSPLGIHSKRVKACLLAGLIGTWSTAGFGVFVVAWAYDRFLRLRPDVDDFSRTLFRRAFGVVILAASGWAAVYAPVLGLSAKATQNQVSLEERDVATQAGLAALNGDPLWGLGSSARQLGVNMISDIELNGLPFVVLTVMALLLPALLQRRSPQGHTVVLTIFLTLLTSQPPAASTWVYVLVVVSYGCRALSATSLHSQDSDPEAIDPFAISAAPARRLPHS